jgi:hypothetical protein
MIKFSLLGETILEWNDKDIEHYHARRMAMDSMLCRFKATYPAERIDSVRSLLEDKERQMFQIVRLMDEQQSINKKIANQIPVIVQKSVQEQSKKPKRKGFLGIFGKKKEVTPAVSCDNRIYDWAQVNYSKIQKLFDLYHPNIVIGGHTLTHFIRDVQNGSVCKILGEEVNILGHKEIKSMLNIKSWNYDSYYNNNILMINTKHPSIYDSSELILAIRNWWINNKTT